MKWILIIYLFSISYLSKADVNIDTSTNTVKSFSENDWQRITKNHSYEQPKSPRTDSNKNNSFQFSSPGWFKYFFYFIIIALLVFLLYKLVNNIITPSNRRFEAILPYEELADEEISLDKNILERNLAEALRKNDFRRAMRFSYLIAIRELSVLSLIVPAKEKTNYEYLLELSSHPLFGLFSEITRSFEKSWYGEIIPEPIEYASFEEKFNRFRMHLNSENQKTHQ